LIVYTFLLIWIGTFPLTLVASR